MAPGLKCKHNIRLERLAVSFKEKTSFFLIRTQNDVHQIGIEIHTDHRQTTELIELINNIRKLYEMGFRLISTDNNECMGKMKGYYALTEIVLYRAE
jgi:hypothetical protein